MTITPLTFTPSRVASRRQALVRVALWLGLPALAITTVRVLAAVNGWEVTQLASFLSTLTIVLSVGVLRPSLYDSAGRMYVAREFGTIGITLACIVGMLLLVDVCAALLGIR